MADTGNDRAVGLALLAGAVGALVAGERMKSSALKLVGWTLAGASAWKFLGANVSDIGQRVRDLFNPPPPPERATPLPPSAPPAAPNPDADFAPVLVQGLFVQPVDGGLVDIGPFDSTYRVTLDVMNLGDATISGPVDFTFAETPLFGAAKFLSARSRVVTIPPKGRVSLEVNAPTDSGFSPNATVIATARLNGHWLATASYSLE